MLPFLKHRQEAVADSDDMLDNRLNRKPDDDAEYDMFDAVAHDLMTGIKKDDFRMVRGALSSLWDHFKAQDEYQDREMEEQAKMVGQARVGP